MVHESIMHEIPERRRRILWAEEVRSVIRDMSYGDARFAYLYDVQPKYADLKDYYGMYEPRDAAYKYLHDHHLGEGS